MRASPLKYNASVGERILEITDDFWNVRGEFKIAGLIDVGTHASLVRRSSGGFVMLDAYTLQGEIKERIDARTNGGADIEAIINLHPFHTVHVQRAHQQYPDAKLYGTRRHHEKFPDLPWQPERSESDACAALFADDLQFSVPEGVDFISDNDRLHFSSVLAFHMASKTIHSDDTLMYLRLPGLLAKIKPPQISFHTTLSGTLEKRPGAAAAFRAWVLQLAERWDDAQNLCAAHTATMLGEEHPSLSVPEEILRALRDVEKTLRAHEEKFPTVANKG